METKTTIPPDELEDNDKIIASGTEVYNALAPCVKKFLTDYFGERLYTLESETYREVEEIIRRDLEINTDGIPDHLYRNRTKTDHLPYYKLINNFNENIAPIKWPEESHWYDRQIPMNDDDKSLEDIPESELTENQKLAKLIIDSVDRIQIIHNRFANFMKQGCAVFIPALQSFLVETSSFDLSILTHEGLRFMQMRLDAMANRLFDHLFVLLDE